MTKLKAQSSREVPSSKDQTLKAPRARTMVYRDWLLALAPVVEEYVTLVCRKRYTEMDGQIAALYHLVQELGAAVFCQERTAKRCQMMRIGIGKDAAPMNCTASATCAR